MVVGSRGYGPRTAVLLGSMTRTPDPRCPSARSSCCRGGARARAALHVGRGRHRVIGRGVSRGAARPAQASITTVPELRRSLWMSAPPARNRRAAWGPRLRAVMRSTPTDRRRAARRSTRAFPTPRPCQASVTTRSPLRPSVRHPGRAGSARSRCRRRSRRPARRSPRGSCDRACIRYESCFGLR